MKPELEQNISQSDEVQSEDTPLPKILPKKQLTERRKKQLEEARKQRSIKAKENKIKLKEYKQMMKRENELLARQEKLEAELAKREAMIETIDYDKLADRISSKFASRIEKQQSPEPSEPQLSIQERFDMYSRSTNLQDQVKRKPKPHVSRRW